MNKKIALQFVAAINKHDIVSITDLMHEDYIFIDTWNNKENKEKMITGWEGYFNWFPNYHIEVTEIFNSETSIGLLGYASGSFKGSKDKSWKLPAFWKVIVVDEKIKLWQVICDAKIPFDIINESEN